MPHLLDSRDPGFAAAFEALVQSKRDAETGVDHVVADILAEVRRRGDAAVLEYTSRFDRLDLTAETMRVPAADIARAYEQAPHARREALAFAARRIEAFHRREMPEGADFVDEVGVRLGYRWTPLAAVGLYVPGGTAAYPSSVLMNALPAKVAGVERVVMCVPMPDGDVDPLVLAAAYVAGIDEIYRIGGAQAIGAMAYGTATIRPVDKIVGPGNAYVAAAKRQVFGTVGIDLVAGPSEILVVADRDNDPSMIAMDLLSQAEHDQVAQAILITDDGAFAQAVRDVVARHLDSLPRTTIAAASWNDHGAVIVVGDLMAEAPPLVDRLAPEHLELAVADPDGLFARIRHAGSVFLGSMTPEAVGDYVAGTNHVLPTGRSARFSSGLILLDFMKRTSFIGCDRRALEAIGHAAVALAEAEGLDAHARSIALRLGGGAS